MDKDSEIRRLMEEILEKAIMECEARSGLAVELIEVTHDSEGKPRTSLILTRKLDR